MNKRLKKVIQYGPPPKVLVEAVRKELRKLVEAEDLDANLGMIGRFANQADDMLMCLKSAEAVMRDEHNVLVPGVMAQPNNVETYGASILRQLVPLLQNHLQAQRETPETLTFAIATARRAGMTDLAAELEKKLVGKPLDGDRPVDGAAASLATIESYLLPPSPKPKPKPKNGKKKEAS